MMMASGWKISTTHILHHRRHCGRRRGGCGGDGRRRVIAAGSASSNSNTSRWQDWWKFPSLEKTGGVSTPPPSLSDILWPSAGAFAAMAVLARLDQMIAHKGVSFTIAPLGAVCAVLFATPSSPAAKRKNMFMAQIACGLFGVLALTAFGPGWVARSIGVAASVAFMITTGAVHPPVFIIAAASLPILFIDAAKFHQLQFWYLLFPGATGCILLCLVQEMVFYLKTNFRF